MSTYKTDLEIPVDIDYDFQPSEVTINSVWIGLKDVLEDLNYGTIERLKDEISRR